MATGTRTLTHPLNVVLAPRSPAAEAYRSEVLAAGVVILREVLDHLGTDRTEHSRRDLLTGAALVAAELPEQDDGAAPPGAFTCC